VARIRLELDQISRDELFMTPRERLQEARARAATTVVAALNAMDGWRTREGRLQARAIIAADSRTARERPTRRPRHGRGAPTTHG
jgi:hypothetical protein